MKSSNFPGSDQLDGAGKIAYPKDFFGNASLPLQISSANGFRERYSKLPWLKNIEEKISQMTENELKVWLGEYFEAIKFESK